MYACLSVDVLDYETTPSNTVCILNPRRNNSNDPTALAHASPKYACIRRDRVVVVCFPRRARAYRFDDISSRTSSVLHRNALDVDARI